MKRGALKGVVIGVVVVALLGVSVAVFAQQVSPKRHPNLAAAQDLVQQAIAKITDAQHSNNYDMKGHAEKAKELLNQAYNEIWLAAQAANAAQ
ncbi:MAG TPA: hypothetical protein VFI08_04500 [Spirochaetia bacterium]|nr:hypothetical protein [Spirochaetia bacterium]